MAFTTEFTEGTESGEEERGFWVSLTGGARMALAVFARCVLLRLTPLAHSMLGLERACWRARWAERAPA